MGYAISLKGAGTGSMVGVTAFQLTQAEYNANKHYYDSLNAFIVITDMGTFDAVDVNYSNGSTELQATNVQDAITELYSKMNTEVQDIDIRLNSDTGKPEWRERGADTWTPFSSGLAVCPIYVRIYGHGTEYDAGGGWMEACGILTSAGNYSAMSISTMSELSGNEYIATDFAATYSSNDHGSKHSETQAHIYTFNMPNKSEIDVVIMTDIVAGYWYNSEENSSDSHHTAYVKIGKDGKTERISGIPEGYTQLSQLIYHHVGSRTYWKSDAYLYIKR